MESPNDYVIFKREGTSRGIALNEVARGFAFSVFPLTNLEHVYEFKREQNAQTYIMVHQHAFCCDPIAIEVMWWLNSQLHAYTYNRSYLFVDRKTERD